MSGATRSRARDRLSSAQVAHFVKQPRADKTQLLHDGAGLYLIHDKRGGISWAFKYRHEGNARTFGLGAWPDCGLADARKKHVESRRRLKVDGVDPLEHQNQQRQARRRASANATTFKQAADAWIASHRAGWGEKSVLQRTSMLKRYVDEIMGDLDVKDVDVNSVLRVLEQETNGERLWISMPETGRKLRSYIDAILGWAAARELRSIDNPAARDRLKHLLPAHAKTSEVKHHVALPYTEMRDFLSAVRSQSGVAAAALEFTVLTATRTGEVLGATWGEVDLNRKTWTIPAQRTKTGRRTKEEHRVPLAAAALALLTKIRPESPKASDYVFVGASGRPLSNMAMLQLLKRMGRHGITVHGTARSGFRDWGAEATTFPRELLEKALGHVVGDETERAYQRGGMLERRREVMEAWAKYCTDALPVS